MSKKCSGCGCTLQCDNKKEPGFIPESKYNDANYCMRCFRLTHYGDKQNSETLKSIREVIDKVNKSNSFKVYLIDLLNINNNTINIFNKISGNKLLLISKSDLISESININNVTDNIRVVYDIKCDIKYVNVKNDDSVKCLLRYFSKNNIKDIFFIGPTNSGKSTLINKILDINNSNIDKLTISNKRNTTLEFMNIKVSNNLTIIDSPGVLLNDYELNSKYKSIIKPITFNMKNNEILLINDFYIKFKNNTSVTIYTYDDIKVNKYYKDIDNYYEISVSDNTDLCINGFGFIRVKNKNDLSISKLNKELISIRKSIISNS